MADVIGGVIFGYRFGISTTKHRFYKASDLDDLGFCFYISKKRNPILLKLDWPNRRRSASPFLWGIYLIQSRTDEIARLVCYMHNYAHALLEVIRADTCQNPRHLEPHIVQSFTGVKNSLDFALKGATEEAMDG